MDDKVKWMDSTLTLLQETIEKPPQINLSEMIGDKLASNQTKSSQESLPEKKIPKISSLQDAIEEGRKKKMSLSGLGEQNLGISGFFTHRAQRIKSFDFDTPGEDGTFSSNLKNHPMIDTSKMPKAYGEKKSSVKKDLDEFSLESPSNKVILEANESLEISMLIQQSSFTEKIEHNK